MSKRIIYSGDQPGWITATANMLMDRGAEQAPLSTEDLIRRVPGRVSTARNDGHVTAAENGYDRNDYRAGYRIWVEGVLAALRRADLITGGHDGWRWTADPDRDHKIRFFGKTYPVYGKTRRRESRDRYMLGARDEVKASDDYMKPSLGSGGVLRGDTPPLKVKITTGRVHATIKDPEPALEIHPLALAIPPMTPDEQQLVRADIERHGVKVPILMYPDKDDLSARGKPKIKVLDGRHRAYFASVTGQPVVLEEFEGTEQEARDHVASLNLHRRHLTRQQRALAAERLYGEQARKEAKKAAAKGRIRGNKSRSPSPSNLPETGNGRQRGREAHQVVRDMAGGVAAGFSEADAKAAAIIAQAPKTAARVDAGEIKNTNAAVREAKAEIAGAEVEPKTAGGTVLAPKTANSLLGEVIYRLKLIEQDWPAGGTIANADELDGRLGEIIVRAQRLRKIVSRGRVS